MNYCIYKNRELTITQFESYNLNITRPYIQCKNNFELLYVSKSINNRKSHFRYKNTPEWYLQKYGKGGESELHLTIKEHLYTLLKKDGYDCVMEKNINNIRPDVMEINRKMVYEIQCSYINEKTILEKTNEYKKMGYITWWYFHEKMNKYKHLMEKMKGYLFILDFTVNRKNYLKYFTEDKFM